MQIPKIGISLYIGIDSKLHSGLNNLKYNF